MTSVRQNAVAKASSALPAKSRTRRKREQNATQGDCESHELSPTSNERDSESGDGESPTSVGKAIRAAKERRPQDSPDTKTKTKTKTAPDKLQPVKKPSATQSGGSKPAGRKPHAKTKRSLDSSEAKERKAKAEAKIRVKGKIRSEAKITVKGKIRSEESEEEDMEEGEEETGSEGSANAKNFKQLGSRTRRSAAVEARRKLGIKCEGKPPEGGSSPEVSISPSSDDANRFAVGRKDKAARGSIALRKSQICAANAAAVEAKRKRLKSHAIQSPVQSPVNFPGKSPVKSSVKRERALSKLSRTQTPSLTIHSHTSPSRTQAITQDITQQNEKLRPAAHKLQPPSPSGKMLKTRTRSQSRLRNTRARNQGLSARPLNLLPEKLNVKSPKPHPKAQGPRPRGLGSNPRVPDRKEGSPELKVRQAQINWDIQFEVRRQELRTILQWLSRIPTSPPPCLPPSSPARSHLHDPETRSQARIRSHAPAPSPVKRSKSGGVSKAVDSVSGSGGSDRHTPQTQSCNTHETRMPHMLICRGLVGLGKTCCIRATLSALLAWSRYGVVTPLLELALGDGEPVSSPDKLPSILGIPRVFAQRSPRPREKRAFDLMVSVEACNYVGEAKGGSLSVYSRFISQVVAKLEFAVNSFGPLSQMPPDESTEGWWELKAIASAVADLLKETTIHGSSRMRVTPIKNISAREGLTPQRSVSQGRGKEVGGRGRLERTEDLEDRLRRLTEQFPTILYIDEIDYFLRPSGGARRVVDDLRGQTAPTILENLVDAHARSFPALTIVGATNDPSLLLFLKDRYSHLLNPLIHHNQLGYHDSHVEDLVNTRKLVTEVVFRPYTEKCLSAIVQASNANDPALPRLLKHHRWLTGLKRVQINKNGDYRSAEQLYSTVLREIELEEEERTERSGRGGTGTEGIGTESTMPDSESQLVNGGKEGESGGTEKDGKRDLAAEIARRLSRGPAENEKWKSRDLMLANSGLQLAEEVNGLAEDKQLVFLALVKCIAVNRDRTSRPQRAPCFGLRPAGMEDADYGDAEDGDTDYVLVSDGVRVPKYAVSSIPEVARSCRSFRDLMPVFCDIMTTDIPAHLRFLSFRQLVVLLPPSALAPARRPKQPPPSYTQNNGSTAHPKPSQFSQFSLSARAAKAAQPAALSTVADLPRLQPFLATPSKSPYATSQLPNRSSPYGVDPLGHSQSKTPPPLCSLSRPQLNRGYTPKACRTALRATPATSGFARLEDYHVCIPLSDPDLKTCVQRLKISNNLFQLMNFSFAKESDSEDDSDAVSDYLGDIED